MSDLTTRTALAKVVYVVDKRFAGAFEIVIDRGSQDGVNVGDRFLVFGLGPVLADPDTGEKLGTLEVVRGRAIVSHVQPRIATLRSTEKRRRFGTTRRVVREVGGSSLLNGLGSNRVIEEQIPEVDEDVPFADVSVGDFAKPI